MIASKEDRLQVPRNEFDAEKVRSFSDEDALIDEPKGAKKTVWSNKRIIQDEEVISNIISCVMSLAALYLLPTYKEENGPSQSEKKCKIVHESHANKVSS
jgi:hypothetical protein